MVQLFKSKPDVNNQSWGGLGHIQTIGTIILEQVRRYNKSLGGLGLIQTIGTIIWELI